MKKNFLISALILLVTSAYAQFPPMAETQKLIVIETDNTSLVFSVGKNRKLYQVYLGEKLMNTEDYKTLPNLHEAYVPSGMDNLFEPAIKMLHNDGNPSLELLVTDDKETRDGDVIRVC